jgi:hypothetical protein
MDPLYESIQRLRAAWREIRDGSAIRYGAFLSRRRRTFNELHERLIGLLVFAAMGWWIIAVLLDAMEPMQVGSDLYFIR